MKSDFEARSTCRVCSAAGLIEFLDFGDIPPANGFTEETDAETPSFPLVVSVCPDCKHVQLAHTVDRSLLFSEYHYFSSESKPITEHFKEYADSIKNVYLQPDDFVVEIGSNDGVLLKHFEQYNRLGIEPAENVAAVAKDRGVPTRTDFFDAEVARDVKREHGEATVVMANNVVGHIDDLASLMTGVGELLTADGTFVIEVPYFVELFNGNEFDTIYHEHISYFSVHSFVALAERFDMTLERVERVSVHGGSLRVHLQNNTTASRGSLVDDLLALERSMSLDEVATYHEFAEDVADYASRIRTLLNELSGPNVTIAGYGAPAKGNILLNYCDLGSGVIDYVIDTTPAKQGTYTPRTQIPVYPPEHLDEEPPDYALLLAWNYRDAILEKESELREQCQFVIPIPHLDIV